jgi:uncharacterized membrane protein
MGTRVATQQKNPRTKEGVMASVTESVDVEVPVSTAYNQWTQFESFPQFMAGSTPLHSSKMTI